MVETLNKGGRKLKQQQGLDMECAAIDCIILTLENAEWTKCESCRKWYHSTKLNN